MLKSNKPALNLKMKSMTLMFFTPHADDIELGVPFMFIESLRLGNRVIEVIMTNNEFGTNNDSFKGDRLRKIREAELANANRVFERNTNNKVEVVYMGYVDGHLPLNIHSVKRVTKLIRSEKPNIIFTCDPWYAQDFHADHLNTGRLVYFALARLVKADMPKKVFYYYSTKTNYYIRCRLMDLRIASKALSYHKSQYSPLSVKMIKYFYNLLIIFIYFCKHMHISENFREQKFKNKKSITPNILKEMSFWDRIIYYVFSTLTIWGYVKMHISLTPEEVDLHIDYDLKDTLKKKDFRYSYDVNRYVSKKLRRIKKKK